MKPSRLGCGRCRKSVVRGSRSPGPKVELWSRGVRCVRYRGPSCLVFVTARSGDSWAIDAYLQLVKARQHSARTQCLHRHPSSGKLAGVGETSVRSKIGISRRSQFLFRVRAWALVVGQGKRLFAERLPELAMDFLVVGVDREERIASMPEVNLRGGSTATCTGRRAPKPPRTRDVRHGRDPS